MAEEQRPNQAAAPAPAAGGADPTMEDILASIRRILNEDDSAPPDGAVQEDGGHAAAPAAAPPPPVSAAAAAPRQDMALALTESMLVGEPPSAAPPPPPPPARAPAAAPGRYAPAPGGVSDGLMAQETASAAGASLGQLMRAVAQERGAPVQRGGGLTIEDVVRDELRPLLKEWLDLHLPPLVERLVRAEIDRVVGRSMG